MLEHSDDPVDVLKLSSMLCDYMDTWLGFQAANRSHSAYIDLIAHGAYWGYEHILFLMINE